MKLHHRDKLRLRDLCYRLQLSDLCCDCAGEDQVYKRPGDQLEVRGHPDIKNRYY